VSGYAPSQASVEKNPFQFIEAALIEAKQKIEKMKATPQILESLTDVSFVILNHLFAGGEEKALFEGREQVAARELETDERQRQCSHREDESGKPKEAPSSPVEEVWHP
jgi:hypothetical protein